MRICAHCTDSTRKTTVVTSRGEPRHQSKPLNHCARLFPEQINRSATRVGSDKQSNLKASLEVLKSSGPWSIPDGPLGSSWAESDERILDSSWELFKGRGQARHEPPSTNVATTGVIRMKIFWFIYEPAIPGRNSYKTSRRIIREKYGAPRRSRYRSEGEKSHLLSESS